MDWPKQKPGYLAVAGPHRDCPLRAKTAPVRLVMPPKDGFSYLLLRAQQARTNKQSPKHYQDKASCFRMRWSVVVIPTQWSFWIPGPFQCFCIQDILKESIPKPAHQEPTGKTKSRSLPLKKGASLSFTSRADLSVSRKQVLSRQNNALPSSPIPSIKG